MHTETSTARGAARAGAPGAREFLTFRLGAEEYGIDILKVQEIRSYEPPTRIANVPPYVKGVVNLRGVIVPIVDLRVRFGLGAAEYDRFTVVIVLNVGARVIGAVVDSVSDVLELDADSIRDAPPMPQTVGSGYVVGLGTIGDRMLILLDIERLMLSPEMAIAA